MNFTDLLTEQLGLAQEILDAGATAYCPEVIRLAELTLELDDALSAEAHSIRADRAEVAQDRAELEAEYTERFFNPV